MRRWGVFIVLAAAACGADASLAPVPGEFTLRVVKWDVGKSFVVPGALPGSQVGDSLRYTGGTFELLSGDRWRYHVERVTMNDGVEVDRRTISEQGSYRATFESGKIVLQLYQGIMTDDRARTAILRGDSLFHGAYVYSR